MNNPIIQDYLYDNGYHFVKNLGAGAFGEVNQFSKDGKLYNLKTIPERLNMENVQEDDSIFKHILTREVIIMKILDPYNNGTFTELRDVIYDEDLPIGILYDHIFGYPLSDYCIISPCEDETKILDIQDLDNIITDVLSALVIFHEQKISHQDLSRDNIIYDKQLGRAYIIDFGSAQSEIVPDLIYVDQSQSFDDLTKNDLMELAMDIIDLFDISPKEFRETEILPFEEFHFSEKSSQGHTTQDIEEIIHDMMYSSMSSSEILSNWES